MADFTSTTYVDEKLVGTLDFLQFSSQYAEGAAVADAGTLTLTLTETAKGWATPPSYQLFTHNGGIQSKTATFAVNTGQTLVFRIWAPELRELAEQWGDIRPNAKRDDYFEITHTLGAGTNGAFTSLQLYTSLAADTKLARYLYFANAIVANQVTVFGKTPRMKFGVNSGTAAAGCAFAGEGDNSQRVFTPTVLTGWTFAYNAATGTLVATNGTGAAVNKQVLRACIL